MMTTRANIRTVVEALGLPAEARVDARVPKKLLIEQGAPTAADKRAIQDGLDELQWFAACKPATIGVPTYKDETREYLEIAVIGCRFRPGAKVGRLIELIHRAIPYPVLLVSEDEAGLRVSVAHKRAAQNEADKVVIERVVSSFLAYAPWPTEVAERFLDNLALIKLPHKDLFKLYDGWLVQIETLISAQIVGTFSAVHDEAGNTSRRLAIETYARLERELQQLRTQARRAKQMAQRVDLNQKIKSVEHSMDEAKKKMLGGNG